MHPTPTDKKWHERHERCKLFEFTEMPEGLVNLFNKIEYRRIKMNKEYYKKNKEKERARGIAWREKNKERIRAWHKEYYIKKIMKEQNKKPDILPLPTLLPRGKII